jgi:molybdopterin converting factor small subunit
MESKVVVRYFASARDSLDGLTSEEYLASNLGQLIGHVKERHSSKQNFLGILGTSMIALNDDYVFELGNVMLKAGDEVAVIPPISGG